MPVYASGKRLGRKGVDAIFTPEGEQRDAKFLVGVAGILAGFALWATIILDSLYPKLLGSSEISFFLSMTLSSLGLILVISGVGICITYSIFKPVYQNASAIDTLGPAKNRQAVPDGESLLQGSKDGRIGILSSNNLRYGLVAFVQSCAVLVLYSGLTDEFHSNLSMRQWVSSVFPYGQLVLSWEAVLVAATFLGLVVVQFLPGRTFSE